MSEQPSVRQVQEALDGFRPTRRTEPEQVALDDALGRVPAADVVASEPLPGFTRSAVDGYAVLSVDTSAASEQQPASLDVIGAAHMGEPPAAPLQPGTAIAVATGSALPAGADAIVMVEHVSAPGAGAVVHVSRAARAGQHVVLEDDDFAAGAVIARAGHPITAREIAALAAAGEIAPTVRRRPRVAIISTGDEVVPADTRALAPGQVRDAIAPALAALVCDAGGEPVLHGIVPDDEPALERACRAALADCDVLVLSAGSSVGERDLTARVVERLGPPGIWCHGLALRPGKPTLLAEVAGVPLIGLPGNPLSALVVFELVGVPIVRLVGGYTSRQVRPSVRAVLAVDVPSAAGRLEIVQVRLVDGEVHPLPKGSALLSTLVRADGQIAVPVECASLSAGDSVEVWVRAG
ncbi:MAG TPA: gephyrin-like molybdotransferase Glp [Gaiellales bacterium]